MTVRLGEAVEVAEEEDLKCFFAFLSLLLLEGKCSNKIFGHSELSKIYRESNASSKY